MALFGGALGGVVGGATVRLLLDDSQFNRGLAQAEGRTRAAAGGMSRFGGAAKAAFAIAGTAALAFAADSFRAFTKAQQIAAQTGAVLKATGGAAGVTALEVETLASTLRDMSGADDDAIQASENLLLTFRNVHNEAGEGNDIFNQTTRAILDMATAMNQGAIPSQEQLAQTTIQVGKAMNDPIQGMTALRRVGVGFSDSQVELITHLQETGDLMSAQKVILDELTTEFGGAAEAAGDTLGGQLDIAKSKLGDFKEEIGAFLGSGLLLLTGNLQGAASMWVQVANATDQANDALYQIALTAGLDGSAIGNLTMAQSAARTEMQHTASAADLEAAAHQRAAAAANAHRLAELGLAGGLLGIEAASLSASDAQESLAASRAKVNQLADAGKKGTKAYADALDEYHRSALGAVTSQLGLVTAVQQYIKDSGGSVRATRTAIGMIREYGRANGLTAGETNHLIGEIVTLGTKYGGLPHSVTTNVSAPGATGVLSTIDAIKSRIDALHDKAVNIYVYTHYKQDI